MSNIVKSEKLNDEQKKIYEEKYGADFNFVEVAYDHRENSYLKFICKKCGTENFRRIADINSSFKKGKSICVNCAKHQIKTYRKYGDWINDLIKNSSENDYEIVNLDEIKALHQNGEFDYQKTPIKIRSKKFDKLYDSTTADVLLNRNHRGWWCSDNRGVFNKVIYYYLIVEIFAPEVLNEEHLIKFSPTESHKIDFYMVKDNVEYAIECGFDNLKRINDYKNCNSSYFIEKLKAIFGKNLLLIYREKQNNSDKHYKNGAYTLETRKKYIKEIIHSFADVFIDEGNRVGIKMKYKTACDVTNAIFDDVYKFYDWYYTNVKSLWYPKKNNK